MNSRLEQFIQDHREDFDSEEPGKKVWENIQLQVDPGKKKKAPVIRINPRWIQRTAAAAALLILAGAAGYYLRSRHEQTNTVAQTTPATTPVTQTPTDTTAAKPQETIAQSGTNAPAVTPGKSPDRLAATTPKANDSASDAQSAINEEMYHYARIVELKHKELKAIEKDEPLLYRQFASDVYKLDSVYHSLQDQLPKNPNREQILEAMLQNLQLQMGLLNHQLDIIKEINHSKKTAYEKAYKTA